MNNPTIKNIGTQNKNRIGGRTIQPEHIPKIKFSDNFQYIVNSKNSCFIDCLLLILE